MTNQGHTGLPTTEAEFQEAIAQAIAAHDAKRAESSNTEKGCTYKTFMACNPRNFKGSEGAVGLIHWIAKTEKVIAISGCTEEQKVLYVTCLFEDEALAWWNSQVQTMGEEKAHAMPWTELKELLMKEYCSKTEIRELEQELWHLKMKGTDITSYTTRFNELSRLVPHLVTPEDEKIDKYIRGLPPSIRAPLRGAEPPTYHDVTKRATQLVRDAVQDGTLKQEGSASNSKPEQGHHKRNWQLITRGKNLVHPSPKRQKMVPRSDPIKSGYTGNRPLCTKCNYHHLGHCKKIVCTYCQKQGHFANRCRFKKNKEK